MKKNLVVILSFVTILLTACFDSKKQIVEIEWEDIASAEQSFNNQVEEFQYVKDLEKFLSYNVLSITEDKPFNSDFSFSVDFDENSSVQWWVNFSQKKISKAHNLESADIEVEIVAEKQENDSEPFNLSWSVSLLYKDDEMYAKLHGLNIFMWEWNMVAKMYTLLWDMLVDNWVDLEVHSWWIVVINDKENVQFPYIMSTFKNVLKTENIGDSPDFLWSVAELIDIISSYINLWVSTNELRLLDYDVSYSKVSDDFIQKEFTWAFQWKDSAFELSFIAFKEWLDIRLYNVKEYDEDTQDYRDVDVEFMFSLKEKWESVYSIIFQSLKDKQKVVDLQWELKSEDVVDFSADFVLEPLEIISWQKISWKLGWSITKKSWESDREFQELTWKVFSLSELLSSL